MHQPDLAALAQQTGLGDAQIHVRKLPVAGARLRAVHGDQLWSRDDGRTIYPASMIKVPLAVAVAMAIADGRRRWDTRVDVDARNATFNDAPSPIVPGYSATVEELVTYMLQRSDNVATNQLFDALGRERATADIQALGYPDVFFRRKLSGTLPLIDDPEATGRNAFSASDAATLFTAIAEDRVPEAPALRRMLATSWWDVKLSRGLEPGDAFAHKTGDTDETSHDGGILTLADDSSRWVVVVYTELPSSEENDLRFGAFMRALRPRLIAPSPEPWSTG
ncbi:MAG: beta-lactamase class [Candidatus Eremiobacteraeota bacterium]|jgi:beta-lactamase class A|nr:beta-lactamase class [Candidatus Eremiobacteraeota bacterium]